MHQTTVQHGSYKFLASRRGPQWTETHDTITRNIRIVFVITADRDVTKPRDIYNIVLYYTFDGASGTTVEHWTTFRIT